MPGDFVLDADFKPDPVQGNVPPSPSKAAPDFIPDEKFVSDEEKEKYGTIKQKALTAAEAAATGFAGPLATAAEVGLSKLGVPGLTPEEQEAREKVNPYTHGIAKGAGLIGGLATGVGELGLLAKGAEAAIGATRLAGATSTSAKVGSAALKGLIEMGGLGAGDEVSDQILGKSNPESTSAAVGSVLSHAGASGLFGTVAGGALSLGGMGAGAVLKNIANREIGMKAAQFLEDFGNRWKFNQENPSLVDSIHRELSDFFGSTNEMADEVYGSKGLKSQAIEKLVPEMSNPIKLQNQKISDILQNKVSEMVKDPETYPSRLTKKLITDSNRWSEVATNPNATSNDVFNATQDLKQQLQAYSKFDKFVGPLSTEKEFIGVAKDLQHQLVGHLEDTNVWGKAGELQKGVNKAFREFLPAQKDFLSKFTTKELGEPIVDPGKINTYTNQLGKPSAEIKQSMMKNYIEAAEKYRDQISSLHQKLGVESPITPSSLNAVKSSYGEETSGSALADQIHGPGITNAMTSLATGLGGAIGGHLTGFTGAEAAGATTGLLVAKKLAPILEKGLGKRIKAEFVPLVLKVIGDGNFSALGEALEHAGNITEGNSAIQSGVDALFSGGNLVGKKVFDNNVDAKSKDKIIKFIEEDGLNKQLQNSLQNSTPKQPAVIPHFAHGGEVERPLESQKPQTKNVDDDKLSRAYPEQGMLLATAKSRVFNYLKNAQPQKNQAKLPFDVEHENAEHKRSYARTLDIADKPLSILKHIQKGTLEPAHIEHMKQMWPEVHAQVSKKITERMLKGQEKGEKAPPFHIRQGLSMLVGAPLDSTMTPAAIQAAQSVFTNQQSSPQSATKNKNNTSKLGEVAKNHQTIGQAAESRQISGKA